MTYKEEHLLREIDSLIKALRQLDDTLNDLDDTEIVEKCFPFNSGDDKEYHSCYNFLMDILAWEKMIKANIERR